MAPCYFQVLGWCVELVRASRVVVDDTVAIDTNTSNINRPFSYKSKLGAAAKASKKVSQNLKYVYFGNSKIIVRKQIIKRY